LETAAQHQIKARLLKIKLGLTGVIATIGYGILGIPGLIVGSVIGLFKAVK
jgi:putative component of toxin-antitoxin plasmid stabilization module